MRPDRPSNRSGSHLIASRLGPDARALLRAAEHGDDPSDADRARVRHGIVAALGVAVATGAAGTAAAATTGTLGAGSLSAAAPAVAAPAVAAPVGAGVVATGAIGGFSLAAKVAAVVLAVGAAGGAIAIGTSVSSEPGSAVESIEPRAPLARETLEPPAVAPAEVAVVETAADAVEPAVDIAAVSEAALAPVDVRVEPRAPRAPRRAVAQSVAPIAALEPAVAAPVAAPSTLGDEMPLVRAAWSSLRAGRPDEALASLDAHAARFPGGDLAPERDAARAVALCAAGRTDEGARAAGVFLAAHPRSLLAPRVRAACP